MTITFAISNFICAHLTNNDAVIARKQMGYAVEKNFYEIFGKPLEILLNLWYYRDMKRGDAT